jgi:hypothetical protein
MRNEDKIERHKYSLDEIMRISREDHINYHWELTRINDGLVKKSVEITWLEFNEDGTPGAKMKDKPAVGRSLLMSPFNNFFTWQTTTITKLLYTKYGKEGIVEVAFETLNSEYVLKRI